MASPPMSPVAPPLFRTSVHRRLVPFAAALVVLAGCTTTDTGIASAGGVAAAADSATDPDAAPTDIAEQRLAFAACMRANGVPLADPGGGQGGGLRALTEDVAPDVLAAAQEECDSIRPQGGGRNAADLTEEDKQKLLDVAACLRDEGYDVPDPTFDGQGGALRGGAGGIDPREDGFREAAETCRSEAGLEAGPGRGGARP